MPASFLIDTGVQFLSFREVTSTIIGLNNAPTAMGTLDNEYATIDDLTKYENY